MVEEFHYNDAFHLPNDNRIAVALTFDFQGGEPIRPLKNGRINYEEYTQAEYGPNTGIYRILRILGEEGVKATFLICGGIAERYPEAVKEIAARGHEVAGHGYHHEVARDLERHEENDVMHRAGDIIKNRVGKAPVGWRSCTQSPNTLELLMEHGYLWNSNDFSHDLPFLWKHDGRQLVELPRQPFGDGRAYGHRDEGTSEVALTIWKGMFDELHEESASLGARYVPFQFHPYISGRPGRTKALRTIIQHMKRAKGVWFTTGSEMANWCLEQVFEPQRTASPRRTAALAS